MENSQHLCSSDNLRALPLATFRSQCVAAWYFLEIGVTGPEERSPCIPSSQGPHTPSYILIRRTEFQSSNLVQQSNGDSQHHSLHSSTSKFTQHSALWGTVGEEQLGYPIPSSILMEGCLPLTQGCFVPAIAFPPVKTGSITGSCQNRCTLNSAGVSVALPNLLSAAELLKH